MSKNAITNSIRTRIKVTGIVQGVGFRPYVYRHAIELKLNGSVLNNQQGVTIELQGEADTIDNFVEILRQSPPPLARIDNIQITTLTLEKECNSFTIIQSEGEGDAVVAVSADKSTCQDCLDDMADPDNRHYGYPFTNCTNCGPRYTLINALPYDRKHTSMAGFEMCDDCEKAYRDPLDRRYHAQPVSCPVCGPHVSLLTNQGKLIAERDDALNQTIERLAAGDILAIKGLGGFHLVCDATNELAVQKLRERKQRPAKPLAVMAVDEAMARKFVSGNEAEWQLLSSKERPITLMRKASNHDAIAHNPNIILAPSLAPGIDKLGIFLPYTPLHHLLLSRFQRPLVATSANLSGEPIITNKDDILIHLGHVVDAVLDHDRAIINGCDDSVVQIVAEKLQVMRMARGYAPFSLHSKTQLPQRILAVGAQQKNTIAFGFGNNLFLSPHIGDLFSLEAETYFSDTLGTFKRLYDFNPDLLVRDKHPDYAPSQWAQSFYDQNQEKNGGSVTIESVQHHYAHVLSLMAVNQYTGKVLGLSFDGTGLGEDGTLWGGEALLADIHGFERIAHLQAFKLIGGEQAIKDPRRLLLSLLFERFSLEQVLDLKLDALQSMPKLMVTNLHKLWLSNSGCTLTSSIGRLFDAAACALGLIEKTQFEGQAGMLIEAAANRVTTDSPNKEFSLNLTLADAKQKSSDAIPKWDGARLIADMLDTLAQTNSSPKDRQACINRLAQGFMEAIGDKACCIASEITGEQSDISVALCGGVFQNRYLSEYCINKLMALGISHLESGQIPINDGGIALGQVWYGLHNS